MIYYRKGRLTAAKVGFDPTQPALRTGYGFFETIAWNGRRICHLDRHLKRVRKSLVHFGVTEEGVDYSNIINDVIGANKLRGRFARVNIFFPVEHKTAFPIICAAPFEYVSGRIWRICPSEDIFLSSLMRHKSMNRMSYFNAWQRAYEQGFDDALLQDFSGNVLESSFASLLFRTGDVFIEPQSEYKLPGTAMEIASEIIDIESRPVSLADVAAFDNVFALNSLGGMIPVSAIGSATFETDSELSQRVTEKVLELR